jgi:hypothetical protein
VARTLYIAAEGAHGLAGQRAPALADSLDMPLETLAEQLRIVPEPVRLLDEASVGALIAANRDWSPEIVIFDTLSRCIAGEDENSASTMAQVHDALKRVAVGFGGATVLVAHHTGKDESKGARGSYALIADADFALKLTADKEAGAAKLYVEKMRDAEDAYDVHYRVTRTNDGPPVARRIEPGEYKSLTASMHSPLRSDVGRALRKLGAAGEENAVPTPVLALELVHEKELADPSKYATPEQRERAEQAAARKLTDHLKPKDGRPGDLLAYVICDAWGEPVKPYLWARQDEAKGEDDD